MLEHQDSNASAAPDELGGPGQSTGSVPHLKFDHLEDSFEF